jgi:putative ABC transport system permease protein
MGASGPRLLRSLGQILIPADDREFILGDLEELHAENCRRHGRITADLRYLRGVLASAWHRRLRPPRLSPEALLTDLQVAIRSSLRDPRFTATAVLTLALGVGATLAVFGMVSQILLRPLAGVPNTTEAAYLHLRHPDRDLTQGSGQGFAMPLPDFDVIRSEATLIEAMALYGRTTLDVSVGDARPVKVDGNVVYADFFETLGIEPSEGRLFGARATDPHGDPFIAVISERLRTVLFDPSEDAVGRTLRLNGREVAVVGVVAGGFLGPERGAEIDVWMPYPALRWLAGASPEQLGSRQALRYSDMLVLPAANADLKAVEDQVRSIVARLSRSDIETAGYLEVMRPTLVPGLFLPPSWRDRTYRSLRLLGGIVLLVLFLACANVANLLLVRDAGRRDQVATRRALGASSGRIVREHLLESLILAALGVIAGMGVAVLVAIPFRGMALERMPTFEAFRVDPATLGFAALAAVATAVLFGTLPAMISGRLQPATALRTSRGLQPTRVGVLRWLISTLQVALSVALLVGGMLLARTIHNVYSTDTGLAYEDVLAVTVDVPQEAREEEGSAILADLLATVAALPEVETAALDVYGPFGDAVPGRARLLGGSDDEAIFVTMVPTTRSWFDVFDVEILDGHLPEANEWGSAGGTPAVITASLAKRLFGRVAVSGRELIAGLGDGSRTRRIAAVVNELRLSGDLGTPTDAVFVPFPTAPQMRSMTLLVETTQPGGLTAQGLRETVESVLPGQAVPPPTPLLERLRHVHAEKEIIARLVGLLAVLGVAVATVGLFAVVSFTVTARRREFGIRMALGAEGWNLTKIVTRYAGSIVLAGAALGLVGAHFTSQALRGWLFGVHPGDAMSYAIAATFFAAVAGSACWWPARTAARLDPMRTLRAD